MEIRTAAVASAPMDYQAQPVMKSFILSEEKEKPAPVPQVRKGRRAVASLETGKVLWNGERPIPEDLRRALLRVRDFYRTEFATSARRDLMNGLDGSFGQGASAADLAKIAVRPVLSLGQERYRVVNELVAIKEQVSRAEPPVAHALLRTLVE